MRLPSSSRNGDRTRLALGAPIDLFAGYRRYEAQYAPSGIRVNAIAPNVTRTESVGEYLDENPSIEEGIVRQTPLGRVARSEDIAQAAAWLLSDRSSYVAGVTLPIDGGMVAVRT